MNRNKRQTRHANSSDTFEPALHFQWSRRKLCSMTLTLKCLPARNGNIVIGEMKQESHSRLLYNYSAINLEPAVPTKTQDENENSNISATALVCFLIPLTPLPKMHILGTCRQLCPCYCRFLNSQRLRSVICIAKVHTDLFILLSVADVDQLYFRSNNALNQVNYAPTSQHISVLPRQDHLFIIFYSSASCCYAESKFRGLHDYFRHPNSGKLRSLILRAFKF